MNTNKRHFFYVIVAALTLAGCGGGSSGLSNAVTDPLAPKPNGNYKQLAIESTDTNSLLHDEKSTITITDEEKKGADKDKTYKHGDRFDISYKKQDKITGLSYERKDAEGKIDGGQLLLYKQNYSVVAGTQPTYAKNADGSARDIRQMLDINSIQGEFTRDGGVPSSGKIRYSGKAFASADNQNGKLDYTVDYHEKSGSGTITGLKGLGDISLEKGPLRPRPDKSNGIDSTASSSELGKGRYNLTLFGPRAEEVAGSAYFEEKKQSIGFGGKQQ